MYSMIAQLRSRCFAVLKKLRQLGLEHHLDKQKKPSTYDVVN
jgi:hypothetical protein